jgi:predicted nucleic acid-binding protein
LEVIDSRFLLEYFLSDDQETRSKTSKHLRNIIEKKTGILPTIVVTEIVRYVSDKRGREEATIRYLSLKRSGLVIANLTAEVARQAGLLKSEHPNIPTGDCIVASTALASRAKILSDDKHYDEIKGVARTWL